jgi:hypothetical protein
MKEIGEKELKEGMEICYKECFTEKRNFRKIIAKAVNLGMMYQETKIRQGIDIVFNELHNKNI